MSKMTIGLVTEGPRDFELISELIEKIIPGDHRYLPLQPNISATEGFGSHGAGWKGVISWCNSFNNGAGIFAYMDDPLTKVDILIIHVDADIARESEVNCAKPCPDAQATVHELENMLKNALNISDLLNRILFCIPSDNTEAWILSAFSPAHHNPPTNYIECIQKPDYIISTAPLNLLKRKDGKPKKVQATYRDTLIPKVLECWDNIRQICVQAENFHQKLRQL